jgi:ribosomal protein S14
MQKYNCYACKTIKDRKQRKSYKQNECFVLSQICMSNVNFTFCDHQITSSYHFTKIRNTCLITSKKSAVNSRFRISRHKFREHALFGNLTGVKKAI